MSPRPRPQQQLNESIHTSNLTSGYFLGNAQRPWMQPGANNTASNIGRASEQYTPVQRLPHGPSPSASPIVQSSTNTTLPVPTLSSESRPIPVQHGCAPTNNSGNDKNGQHNRNHFAHNRGEQSPNTHNVSSRNVDTANLPQLLHAANSDQTTRFISSGNQSPSELEHNSLRVTGSGKTQTLPNGQQRYTMTNPNTALNLADSISNPFGQSMRPDISSISQMPTPPIQHRDVCHTSVPGDTTTNLSLVAPRKSRRLSATTNYLSFLIAKVTQLHASFSGAPGLVYFERRVACLNIACTKNDHLYLLLHQIYCLRTLDMQLQQPPWWQHSRVSFGSEVDAGFGWLEIFLLKNNVLPAQALTFFSGFMYPKERLQQDPSLVTRLMAIKRFLQELGTQYVNLCSRCAAWGSPPSPYLLATLGCGLSALIQEICFNSIVRRLYPNLSAPHEKELASLFTRYQDSLQQWMNSANSAVPDPATVQLQNNYFRTECDSVARQHQTVAVLADTFMAGLTKRFELDYNSAPLPPPISLSGGAAQSNDRPSGVADNSLLPHGQRQVQYDNSFRGINQSHNSVPNTAQLPTYSSNMNTASLPNSARVSQRNAPQPVVPLMDTTATANLTVGTYPRPTNPNPASSHTSLANGRMIRLLPEVGLRMALLATPSPDTTALHQAHLITPAIHPSAAIVVDEQDRLYCCSKEFILQPKKIDPHKFYTSWRFDVSKQLLSRTAGPLLAATQSQADVQKVLSEGAFQFQLRCIAIPLGREIPDTNDSIWATAPTYWPVCGFFSINDIFIEPRRKSHYGRDLPAQLIDVLKPGENLLQFSNHHDPHDAGKLFAIAVEIVEVLSHKLAICLPVPIDKIVALQQITKSLNTQDDDDDIVMLDAHLTVDITDPFTSRLFETPVRGKHCRHKNCFDLELFLRSRPSQKHDSIVSTDDWSCPICKGDARPRNLVIDQFLLDVRNKLMETGADEIKAISIKADGTWEPKVEQSKSVPPSNNMIESQEDNYNVPVAPADEPKTSAQDKGANVHQDAAIDHHVIILDDI